MRVGGSASKGGAYERIACNLLSVWITENPDTQSLFRRSILSGGHHTNARKRGSKDYESQAGDLSSIDPLSELFISKIAVECKHVADLHVEQLIYDSAPNSKEHILSFWRKHINDVAMPTAKYPLLMGRQNRKADLLLITIDMFERVKGQVFPLGIFPQHDCVIYGLVHFLSNYPYKQFEQELLKNDTY